MNDTGLPPKRSFFSLTALLLFILLVAAFAFCVRFITGQQANGQLVNESIGVFDSRLQNLENTTLAHEKRLKDLEDATQKLSVAAPAAPAATPTPPTTSSAATAAPVGDDRIQALEKEIATLKTAMPLADSERIPKTIHMLSAFHRLSDKIIGGKPFTSELSAFEDAAHPDEPAGGPLAALAPYADSGIPTFATLLVTFDQSVEGLNATEAIPPANATMWERFKYNLAHMVTVRRIDDAQTGKGTDAVIGRAQAHLEREEIEAAVSEIKSLPENVRGNFSAWIDDAQMVTDAPSLVDQIEEQVLQKAFEQPPAPAAAIAPAIPQASPAPNNAAAPTPAQDAAPAAPHDSKTEQ